MRRATDHTLADDLARWQTGQLSADELRQRHPAADVDAVVAAHARVLTWAQTPVPDPEIAWARVTGALVARSGPPRPRRLRRSVVAAIIATAVAGPAVSYAAAPDAVRSGIRQVADLFTDRHDDGPRRADDAEREDTTVEPEPGTGVAPPPVTGDSSLDASELDRPGSTTNDDADDRPDTESSPGSSSDDGDKPEVDDPDVDGAAPEEPAADESETDDLDPSVEPDASQPPSVETDGTEASEEPDDELSDLRLDAQPDGD